MLIVIINAVINEVFTPDNLKLPRLFFRITILKHHFVSHLVNIVHRTVIVHQVWSLFLEPFTHLHGFFVGQLDKDRICRSISTSWTIIACSLKRVHIINCIFLVTHIIIIIYTAPILFRKSIAEKPYGHK